MLGLVIDCCDKVIKTYVETSQASRQTCNFDGGSYRAEMHIWKVMNQSIMHYFQTLGKMNLNLNGQLKDDRVHNMDETYCFKTMDELYNASYQNDNLDVQVNDFEFSLDEVKDAITQCKNNKSPGLDSITNELLKNGGDSVHLSLYAMFVKLREFECVPDDWNKGIIIPIHKKRYQEQFEQLLWNYSELMRVKDL